MKQVQANFLLEFTSDDASGLPSPAQMKHDLEELFATVLDSYLDKKNVEGNEAHLILAYDLTIEDYE